MTHRIRICDLETTGFAPPEHAPCEIAFCDLVTRETDLAGAPINWHLDGGEGYLCNPGRNIPPENSAIHHIIDADVEGLMTWPEIAEGVIGSSVIKATAYAAHNAKFERQWITDDLTGGAAWICTYKCALRLWPESYGKPTTRDQQGAAPAGRTTGNDLDDDIPFAAEWRA